MIKLLMFLYPRGTGGIFEKNHGQHTMVLLEYD